MQKIIRQSVVLLLLFTLSHGLNGAESHSKSTHLRRQVELVLLINSREDYLYKSIDPKPQFGEFFWDTEKRLEDQRELENMKQELSEISKHLNN